MLHRWGAGYMLIEATAYQLTMVQAAQRAGYPVRPVRPDRDKVARAQPLAARMHQGAVYFRSGARWLHDLEDEMIMFPAGQHDDQVDAVAMAATALYKVRVPAARLISVSH